MNLTISVMILSLAICSSVIAQDEPRNTNPQDRLTFLAMLEPVKSTVILNAVPGRSTVRTILPDGTPVKAGDVICTLDLSQQTELVNSLKNQFAEAQAGLAMASSEQDSHKRQLHFERQVADYEVGKAKRALEAWTQGEYPLRKVELEGALQIGRAELELAREFAAAETNTRLETLRAQVEVARAEAKVSLAELQLKHLEEFVHPQRMAELNAEMELTRMQVAQGSDDPRATSFDIEMAARKQEIDILRARLNESQKLLESGRIVAPHDGIVMQAVQQPGRGNTMVLSAGMEVRERQQLMQVHDLSAMKAILTLAPDEAERLIIGSNAEVQVDALPQQPFTGRLTEIGKKPVTRDGKVRAVVRLEKLEDSPLRYGMTAIVTFESDE